MLCKAYSRQLIRRVGIPLRMLFTSPVLCSFGSEMTLVTISKLEYGTLKGVKSIWAVACIVTLVCAVTCGILICFLHIYEAGDRLSPLHQKKQLWMNNCCCHC